jgi:hypothetical protein
MRSDWRTARAWLREAEGWPVADLEAVGSAMKVAVEAGEAGLLACWAAWLASWAGVAIEAARRCREAEARMRIRARAERAEREWERRRVGR